MPYNPGTGIYTLPAIYLAIPGTTIIAAQHNDPLEDLEIANNYARPVIAGGTGGVSVPTASVNLGWTKGTDIPSAAALPVGTDANYFHVTGTTTITSISTRVAGQRLLLEFTGVLTLTHHATNLILIGAANIKTVAGTVLEFVSEGGGSWRQVSMVSRPPTVQVFSAGGTWTRPAGCILAVFEGVGGGGGSGAVNGQAGATGGATGGGGSGFYGKTVPIDVTGTTSAAVTIGAAGAAGAIPQGNGGAGGSTSITIGATTYTWGGGLGSDGRLASGNTCASMEGGRGGIGTNVVGGSWNGGIAIIGAVDANFTSGNGGSNPLGRGGQGVHNIIVGTGTAAVDGQGFGAGGGGGIINQSTADQPGGAGTGGYLRVWEYYG